MATMIEARGLTKRFGRRTAVEELSFDVPAGSVYAFLGPNGAGKTTTIKAIVNIHPPTGGTIRVLDADSRDLNGSHFRSIGYVSENQNLPDWMTVRQFLDYCGPLYPSWDHSFEKKLVEQLDIDVTEKIRRLSRGTRAKVALLSSLCFHPRLLILDEPFSGLDPLVREELIQGILEISEQEEWTIFISSHDLDEVERLADWVGIIINGHLRVSEPIASLQDRFRSFEAALDESWPVAPPDSWLLFERSESTARWIETAYSESSEAAAASLLPPGARITTSPMTLRETFLALTRGSRKKSGR